MFSRLFSRSKTNPFRQSKQVIEFAFACGGRDYYRHVDEMNLPYRRALKALAIYKELDMKCDRYYLDKHIEATDALLNGTRFGVAELMSLKKLNDQLRERSQWIVLEDHVYKLASVRYFDGNENPEDYDWKYASQKIEHWKKNSDLQSFFLSEPIQSLVPFLKDVNINFPSYMEVLQALDQSHLDSIYQILSPSQKPPSPTASERMFWQETQPTSTP